MANEALLRIRVIADTTQAAMGLDKTSQSAGKFQRGVNKAVPAAAAVGVAVLAIGKKALQSASDLEQASGAVETVFGKQATAVKKASQEADTAMGLSAAQYQNYAALVGTALQSAGVSVKDSVEGSNALIQRGADLAATYGGTTADAVEAINAAVARSEFDPLERYGVTLNMTAVNAELAKRGQDKLTGSAAEAAKKAIIMESIMKKSSKTAGQYAREADSAAGSTQTAAAQWENASAALGQALLPVASAVANALGKMATWMQKNSTFTGVLLGVIGGLAAVILVLAAAMKIATVVTWAMNSALLASPITWVVLAVLALVVAITLLWKKSETFRTVVTAVWNAVRAGAVAAANAIKNAFTAAWSKISSAARAVAGFVKGAFNIIRSAMSAVIAVAQRLISRIRSIKVPGSIKSAIDAIRSAISTTISRIGDLIGKLRAIKVPGAVKTALDGIKNAAQSALNVVKDIVHWLGNIPTPHINWPSPPKWLDKVVPGSFSATSPATPAARAASPSLLGTPRVPGRTTNVGGGVTIQVTGALDPEAVARQIGRILGAHDRRIGRTVPA